MVKTDSFEGQRMLVIPQKVIDGLMRNELTQDLYVTDIGYYPNAQNHYRERAEGCTENILIICADGKGWIEINQEHKKLQKNQFFFIPPNTPHKYGADHFHPWSIYWIHFNGRKAKHYIPASKCPLEIFETNNSRLEERNQLFEELQIILEEDFSNNNLEYSSILLTHLLASLKYIPQYRKIKEMYQQDNISKAILFMKENLHRKLKLEEIASAGGLSVSHFSLLFKKQISQTPLEYLTMLKVQKACKLLILTSLKIKDISIEVGYDDAYYFSRIFTKTMGMSPSKYKNSRSVG